MRTVTSILFSAVFLVVTTTGSLAQTAIGPTEMCPKAPVLQCAREQSAVCLSHKTKDAKGDCRVPFQRAASSLGRICKGRTIPKAGECYLRTYRCACGCSRKQCKP